MVLDALLLLTFGGPESPDEVMPFLDNVLRGRPVTPERVEQVAAQYLEMGGRSPINDQSRGLLESLPSIEEPKPVLATLKRDPAWLAGP